MNFYVNCFGAFQLSFVGCTVLLSTYLFNVNTLFLSISLKMPLKSRKKD